ncbi:hypothetical protein OV203_50655 [Nannocystis sp. ILAH1]|uniref:hypothetical protein n=1 Tax=Nannocystis sp. ILAH1 TaxID=2996789 RepID=UPI00227173A4|nr:hypothetical protein [Nannocystis sp. ILAH1]MCY0995488.1 hypothetical protein [Nannocystis sp. ILAH1]
MYFRTWFLMLVGAALAGCGDPSEPILTDSGATQTTTAAPSTDGASSTGGASTTDGAGGSHACGSLLANNDADCVCDPGYERCEPGTDNTDCCKKQGMGDGACPDPNSTLDGEECFCNDGYTWCNPDSPDDLSCCVDPDQTTATPTEATSDATSEGTSGGEACPDAVDPPPSCAENSESFYCTNPSSCGPQGSAHYVCEGGVWAPDTSLDQTCRLDRHRDLRRTRCADGPDSGFRVWNGGSDEFNASNWTFEGLRLHHNYVHDVLAEGFYVGYYTDSIEQQPAPYPIEEAKVYRNRVENAGWDGMQFGSCRSGLEVHDNVVTGSGGANEPNQRSSLQWNPGNSGALYNNRFIGGVGVDLQVGCTGGDTKMYGNVFVHSDAGFYLHAGQADAPRYWLFANSVGAPNAVGLRINMNSAPGNCAAGAKLSEMHYASNLLIGSAEQSWEFAAGDADTASWTLEPNLTTNDPAALCLDEALAPTCGESPALAGGGAALADLGLTLADLPGGHFVDLDGRVLAGPSNFGAHQAAH